MIAGDPEHGIAKARSGGEEKVACRIEWQEALSALRLTGATLRDTATRAIAAGASRRELIEWGVECGFKEGQMRNLVSKLLRNLGHRARRPGAGRKIPAPAIALMDLAKERHGALAEKFLYAAARAVRATRLARKEAAAALNASPNIVRDNHVDTDLAEDNSKHKEPVLPALYAPNSTSD